MNGLMLAAPSSGSGKTTVTLGLLRALRNRGVAVASAKAGPDYIDPAFHAVASGGSCVNLDPWAMRPALLRALASQAAAQDTLLVVEGMMGLFDGAADGSGSAADLASLLGLPVILVVDCAKQSQSVAALVRGFRDHRADVRIAGVILNRVGSSRHEAMIRQALSPVGMAVLGAIGRDERLALPERHLGLVQAGEHADIECFIDRAAEIVAAGMDLVALQRIAGAVHLAVPLDTPLWPAGGVSAPPVSSSPARLHRPLSCRTSPPQGGSSVCIAHRDPLAALEIGCRPGDRLISPLEGEMSGRTEGGEQPSKGLNAARRGVSGAAHLPPLGQRIAVACDDAFAFAYLHILDGWREKGAEISFFSPLADDAPDASADAVYLPGGYPELNAGRLAVADRFRRGMAEAAARGAAIYGECGGYMVLGEGLTDAAGARHAMLGLLPLETSFAERRLHLGYRRLQPLAGAPWSTNLTAHEFHYARIVREGQAQRLFAARDAVGEDLGPAGLRVGSVCGSFMHVIDLLDEGGDERA